MSDKKNTLFRKESLERLSSPERLDQLMQVVNPMDWLPLCTFGCFIGIGVIWSVVGRIPIAVSGKGVLIAPRVLVNLESPVSGQLQSLKLQEGQCIKKDEVVATIDPSDLKQQRQQQQAKLQELQQQNQKAATLESQNTQLQKQAIAQQKTTLQQRLQDTQALSPVLREQTGGTLERQRESLQQRLKNLQTITPKINQEAVLASERQRESLQQRLKNAESLLPIFQNRVDQRRQLRSNGALSQEQVLQAEQEYLQNLQSISEIKAQLQELELEKTQNQQKHLDNVNAISEIQAQLQKLQVEKTEAERRYLENLNTISQIEGQLQELNSQGKKLEQDNLLSSNDRKNQILEVERQIAQLDKKIQDNGLIRSGYDGCIQELKVTKGQLVSPGMSLASLQIQNSAESMVGMIYFDVKDGKKIKPNMPIQITPDTVKRQEFGGILGKITSVSTLPITKQGAAAVVGNPEVVDNIIGAQGAKIGVMAHLERDSKTVSAYKWSSSAGPNLKITAGTTTTARVVVEERAPITFLLPILRDWSGIY
jgi:HlyD family secretion protein